jgi:hypothetical protein
MTTLAVAFALAWSAVTIYLGWLGLQNHRLADRLHALEAAAKHESVRQIHSRAA